MRNIAIDPVAQKITLYHAYYKSEYTFVQYLEQFGETVQEFVNRTYNEAIALNNAISRTVFMEDTIVARGVDFNALERFGILPTDSPEVMMQKMGYAYTDNGFMSATPVAGGGFTHKEVNFIMTCKQGKPFGDFAQFNPGEQEILLGLGSTFKIDRIEKIDGRIMVYMTSIN